MDVGAIELLRGAKRPLLLGHYQPDGDTVGSVLGLAQALAATGKTPIYGFPDPLPDALMFLPGASGALSSLVGIPGEVDLIVVLDCADLERLRQLYSEHEGLFSTIPILNIDHHFTNSRFGTINIVDASWAAVSEELYFLIKEWELPVTKPVATCLLAGVIADTQSFRTPSTTSRSLLAAAGLIDAGANLPEVSTALHRTGTPASLRLWGLALNTIQSEPDLLWASVSQSMLVTSSCTPAEADGLIDLLCTVRDTTGVFLFREEGDGSVRVNLRSLNERLNMAEVAARFGGGGHARAAGCHINAGLLDAEAQVLNYVRQKFAEVATTT
jgi:bifunctional oligoribonuclease and PAP phosphatase NrnA